jgi:hypothetical protein
MSSWSCIQKPQHTAIYEVNISMDWGGSLESIDLIHNVLIHTVSFLQILVITSEPLMKQLEHAKKKIQPIESRHSASEPDVPFWMYA